MLCRFSLAFAAAFTMLPLSHASAQVAAERRPA
jgi:hypothetical protein